jgi:hypothetical protein
VSAIGWAAFFFFFFFFFLKCQRERFETKKFQNPQKQNRLKSQIQIIVSSTTTMSQIAINFLFFFSCSRTDNSPMISVGVLLALLASSVRGGNIFLSGIMGNGSAVLGYVEQSRADPVFVAPDAVASPPQVVQSADGELLLFAYDTVLQVFNLSAPLPFSPTNPGVLPFPCVALGVAGSAFTCVASDGRGAKVDISDITNLVLRNTPLPWVKEPKYGASGRTPVPGCLLFDGDSNDEWYHVVGVDSLTGVDVLDLQFVAQTALSGSVSLKAVIGNKAPSKTVRTCINFGSESLFGLVVDSPVGFLIVRVDANQLPFDASSVRTDTKTVRWSPSLPTTLSPKLFGSVNAPNDDILFVTRDSTMRGESTVWIYDGFSLSLKDSFVAPFIVTGIE